MPNLRVFLCVLALAGANIPAVAAECPGNPDALGTSRVVTLSFDQLSQVGSMQYKGILPLRTTRSYSHSMTARCRPIPM
jgi:hypothetical protein